MTIAPHLPDYAYAYATRLSGTGGLSFCHALVHGVYLSIFEIRTHTRVNPSGTTETLLAPGNSSWPLGRLLDRSSRIVQL